MFRFLFICRSPTILQVNHRNDIISNVTPVAELRNDKQLAYNNEIGGLDVTPLQTTLVCFYPFILL